MKTINLVAVLLPIVTILITFSLRTVSNFDDKGLIDNNINIYNINNLEVYDCYEKCLNDSAEIPS